MTHQKRATWAVVALLAGAIGWFLVSGTRMFSHLCFRFQVHIERTEDATPFRAVRCLAFSGQSAKQNLLQTVKDKSERGGSWDGWYWEGVADPFTGHPIEVPVVGSSTDSMLWGTLSFHHDEYLLVVAELADGRWVATVADIPDARTTREMRVVLP